MYLCRYEVACDLFDGKELAGPVPVFFSEKPDDSRARLSANSEWAFYANQCVHAKLMATRELTKEQAVAFLKQPVEGRAPRPMFRQWAGTSQPPAKKVRQEEVPLHTSTGDSQGEIFNLGHMTAKKFKHRFLPSYSHP